MAPQTRASIARASTPRAGTARAGAARASTTRVGTVKAGTAMKIAAAPSNRPSKAPATSAQSIPKKDNVVKYVPPRRVLRICESDFNGDYTYLTTWPSQKTYKVPEATGKDYQVKIPQKMELEQPTEAMVTEARKGVLGGSLQGGRLIHASQYDLQSIDIGRCGIWLKEVATSGSEKDAASVLYCTDVLDEFVHDIRDETAERLWFVAKANEDLPEYHFFYQDSAPHPWDGAAGKGGVTVGKKGCKPQLPARHPKKRRIDRPSRNGGPSPPPIPAILVPNPPADNDNTNNDTSGDNNNDPEPPPSKLEAELIANTEARLGVEIANFGVSLVVKGLEQHAPLAVLQLKSYSMEGLLSNRPVPKRKPNEPIPTVAGKLALVLCGREASPLRGDETEEANPEHTLKMLGLSDADAKEVCKDAVPLKLQKNAQMVPTTVATTAAAQRSKKTSTKAPTKSTSIRIVAAASRAKSPVKPSTKLAAKAPAKTPTKVATRTPAKAAPKASAKTTTATRTPTRSGKVIASRVTKSTSKAQARTPRKTSAKDTRSTRRTTR